MSCENFIRRRLLALLTLFFVVSASKVYTQKTDHEDNGMIKAGRFHVPSFMIIGTEKGGTTDLNALLKLHPDVGAQKQGTKELRFFDTDQESWTAKKYQEVIIGALQERVEPGAKMAALAFLNETQQLAKEDPAFDPSKRVFLPVMTFDSTPDYMYNFVSPKRIKEALPWFSKFVVSLRNPVDRAFSQYRMEKRNRGGVYMTFEENLDLELTLMIEAGLLPSEAQLFNSTSDFGGYDTKNARSLQSSFRMPDDFYGSEDERFAWEKFAKIHYRSGLYTGGLITRGFYAMQIRNWLRYYDSESFLFLKLEDAMKNPGGVKERLDAVLEFVGLSPYNIMELGLDSKTEEKTQASHYVQRHKASEEIKESTRLYLEQLFEPHNKQLASLLGTDWVEPW